LGSLFLENRFKILIVSIILLSFMYGSYTILVVAQPSNIDLDNVDQFKKVDPEDYNESMVKEDLDTGGFTNVLLDLWNYITFQGIEMPVAISFVLSLISTILSITLGIIIASFVYDIIKALPFT